MRRLIIWQMLHTGACPLILGGHYQPHAWLLTHSFGQFRISCGSSETLLRHTPLHHKCNSAMRGWSRLSQCLLHVHKK